MNPQPVIPIPPAQRWKEFRIKFLPGIAFAVALVASIWIWKHWVFPAPMVGRAEAIQANVSSPKAGTLSQLRVCRFQLVHAGDPVADIVTTGPRVLGATLGVIRAEVELLRATMSPAENAQRNMINYEQTRIDYMRQRVELASARVNLILATNEFQRTESLYKEKVLSESVFDASRTALDALRAAVDERASLVEVARESLERIQKINEMVQEPESQLKAAITLQEEKLKLAEAEMSPVTLKAPISGLVNIIEKYSGEAVAVGEPIISISATNVQRIIGYVRQPLYMEPKVGMEVLVRSRRLNSQRGMAKVLAVGSQLQPINDALLPPSRLNVAELGLPILVSLPENFLVHPGEFVDLTLRSSRN